MGLSEPEFRTLQRLDENRDIDQLRLNLDSMRPPHYVTIGPMLCARYPLTFSQANRFFVVDEAAERIEASDPDRIVDEVPILLGFDDAERIARDLDMRLLSESEWEYVCRAGSTSLFWFGDSLPSGDLEKTVCLARFDDEATINEASNRFGLAGLQVGEFCEDSWHDNYKGAPTDGFAWLGSYHHVYRGGSAQAWPWQGCGEWLMTPSAMRTRSDVMMDQGAVRLVKSL